MNGAYRSATGPNSSRTWPVYAGIYMGICGVLVARALDDILSVLAEVIGISTAYWAVIFASPAFVFGAVAWWAVVERPGSFTYRRGGAAGLLTASASGLFWTGRFVQVWGLEMATLPMATLLILLVLGSTALAGVFTGVPLMYVRRRIAER